MASTDEQEELCVQAETRGLVLYAAKESNLGAELPTPAETDSESEESAMEIVAQSMGLNVSIHITHCNWRPRDLRRV